MNKLLLVVFAALLALPALADNRDSAHELHADTITLPKRIGGDIVIKACETCPTRTLLTSANTKYRLGDEEIGLLGMKEFFLQHPFALLGIQLSSDQRSVVMIYAAPQQN